MYLNLSRKAKVTPFFPQRIHHDILRLRADKNLPCFHHGTPLAVIHHKWKCRLRCNEPYAPGFVGGIKAQITTADNIRAPNHQTHQTSFAASAQRSVSVTSAEAQNKEID